MTFPSAEIVKGIFVSMGITYPAGILPPYGKVEVLNSNGDVIEEVTINGVGFGDPMNRHVERDSKYLPIVHVDLSDDSDSDTPWGPMGIRMTPVFMVYYVDHKAGSSATSINPFLAVRMRADALRRKVDASWRTLNSPITVNARVGRVTLNNPWQDYNRQYRADRIAAAFPITCEIRELHPEVSEP